MSKRRIDAVIKHGNHTFKCGLNLLVWQEDGIFFQYAPELDLTGYGNSLNEAQSSFQICLNEFVAYTLNKGTIFDELERLGWTINKKKKRVHAPEKSHLLEDNETYRDLLQNPEVSKSSMEVALPL